VPSGRVELLSEVGSWGSAASKGASRSPGAAKAAKGARRNGAKMERILEIRNGSGRLRWRSVRSCAAECGSGGTRPSKAGAGIDSDVAVKVSVSCKYNVSIWTFHTCRLEPYLGTSNR
jgi:hypothetical protein